MQEIYRSKNAVVVETAAGFIVHYRVGPNDWDQMYLPDATKAEAIAEAKRFNRKGA